MITYSAREVINLTYRLLEREKYQVMVTPVDMLTGRTESEIEIKNPVRARTGYYSNRVFGNCETVDDGEVEDSIRDMFRLDVQVTADMQHTPNIEVNEKYLTSITAATMATILIRTGSFDLVNPADSIPITKTMTDYIRMHDDRAKYEVNYMSPPAEDMLALRKFHAQISALAESIGTREMTSSLSDIFSLAYGSVTIDASKPVSITSNGVMGNTDKAKNNLFSVNSYDLR